MRRPVGEPPLSWGIGERSKGGYVVNPVEAVGAAILVAVVAAVVVMVLAVGFG